MPFMFWRLWHLSAEYNCSLKPLYWYDDPLFKGLAVGGTWGLYEGLRNPDGKTLKLRVNRYVFNPIHDWSYLYQCFIIIKDQPLVVQTLDSAIHQINHYPVDKYYRNQFCVIHWTKIYPMDIVIHPAFEQIGTGCALRKIEWSPVLWNCEIQG